ncbi:MAG TPA: MBL fold metallo-hydrolase [Bacilli bacterium]
MLNISRIPLGPLATNAYVVSNPNTKKAFVIDPGMASSVLFQAFGDFTVEAVILTHAHFDHIGGLEEVRKRTGAPVYIHEREKDWLNDPELNGSAFWPEVGPQIRCRPADQYLQDGAQLELLGEEFKIFHTPGHSPGSISLYCGDMLFCGDVLFRQSVGRTDLPGGSTQELYDSIHRVLFSLPGEVQVYPGHGPETTIAFEKEHNPYV